jgi:manganese/iron transport system permease protein
VSLSSIGGLLIFNLILNPAAAAFQLTYSLRRMFLLSAAFGVLSTWLGLLGSYLFHFPSGATIVLVSTSIFIAAAASSPKRRVKKL